MARILAGLVFALFVLSGCESWRASQMEPSTGRSPAEGLAEIDHEECAREGGTVRAVGMLGLPSCVVPYADAGQACGDSADCEGICKAPNGIAPGEPVTGMCSRHSADGFGCYTLMQQGRVGHSVCVD